MRKDEAIEIMRRRNTAEDRFMLAAIARRERRGRRTFAIVDGEIQVAYEDGTVTRGGDVVREGGRS